MKNYLLFISEQYACRSVGYKTTYRFDGEKEEDMFKEMLEIYCDIGHNDENMKENIEKIVKGEAIDLGDYFITFCDIQEITEAEYNMLHRFNI